MCNSGKAHLNSASNSFFPILTRQPVYSFTFELPLLLLVLVLLVLLVLLLVLLLLPLLRRLR